MKPIDFVFLGWVFLALSSPLPAQTFTFSLSPGLSFSGRDDLAYNASNALSRVEGFPAPMLFAEIGFRFADRLGLGFRLMDLERGTENGLTNGGIMTSLFIRQTPLLAQVKWHLNPVVDGQKWNLAVFAGGGVVLEHRIRRLSVFSNQIRTNLTETQEPLAQVDGGLTFGAELQYRANGVALVRLGIEEILLMRSGFPAYPVVSIGVEVEFGRRPKVPGGTKTTPGIPPPGKKPAKGKSKEDGVGKKGTL